MEVGISLSAARYSCTRVQPCSHDLKKRTHGHARFSKVKPRAAQARPARAAPSRPFRDPLHCGSPAAAYSSRSASANAASRSLRALADTAARAPPPAMARHVALRASGLRAALTPACSSRWKSATHLPSGGNQEGHSMRNQEALNAQSGVRQQMEVGDALLEGDARAPLLLEEPLCIVQAHTHGHGHGH